MKRQWVWSIAVVVMLFALGFAGVRHGGDRSDAVRLRNVNSPGAASRTSSASTSTSSVAPLVTTATSTSTSSATVATSLPQPRTAAAPTNTTRPAAAEPTTTQARRWVTVTTLSHDFDDGGGWHDSVRFDLLTGKARFVLDAFEVGNENGQLNWNIMGADPYHSLAHGQCEGPVTSAPKSDSPSTTANPSPTGPPCNSAYAVNFEIEPGNYYLRVGSTHARWTARVQEFR